MSEVKTSRTLLVSEILRGDPCFEYSSKLAERFNVEINVTVGLALQQADDWDWYWAASRLLTSDGYEKFSQAVNQEESKQAEHLVELRNIGRSVRDRANAEYSRVLAIEVEKPGNWYSNAAYQAANDAYTAITAPMDAALAAARKVTEARVNKVAAKTFAELYIGEDGTTDQTGNDKWYGRDNYDDSYEEDDDY